jgi:hypothetical protein
MKNTWRQNVAFQPEQWQRRYKPFGNLNDNDGIREL